MLFGAVILWWAERSKLFSGSEFPSSIWWFKAKQGRATQTPGKFQLKHLCFLEWGRVIHITQTGLVVKMHTGSQRGSWHKRKTEAWARGAERSIQKICQRPVKPGQGGRLAPEVAARRAAKQGATKTGGRSFVSRKASVWTRSLQRWQCKLCQ